MQKKNTSKNRKGSTTQQGTKKAPARKDPLAPYRKQARKLIDLYFNPDTPPFVEDLLQSFFTRLEDYTQIFWNRRDVLELLLPLWLEDADNEDANILSDKHPIYLDALHES